MNEPGVNKTHHDFISYDRIIEYKNIEIAVLQMCQKKQGVFLEEFEMFYPYLKENFITNRDKILDFLKSNAEKTPASESLTTGLYSMIVNIDYPKLLETFQAFELK